MRKLIILLVLISTTGCYMDIKDTIDNPKQETTVELLELPKDTIIVSIDGSKLYVFEDDEMIMKAYGVDTSDTTVVHDAVLALLGFIIILLFFAWMTARI